MSQLEAESLAQADAELPARVERHRPGLPRQRGAAARQVQGVTPTQVFPATEHKPHVRSIADTATLVHGFSMGDVNAAAATAVRKDRAARYWLDQEEREQTAWHGVVELLYSCGCGRGECDRTEPLAFYELVFAGEDALRAAVRATLHHHGRVQGGDAGTDGAPNFAKFWLPVRHSKHFDDDGFSEHLCEKLSLRDVLGTLTPGQYAVIATLAAFDNDGVKAAEALGMKHATFHSNLGNARKRIAAVWFEHETPPTKAKPGGDTCLRGHLRAEHGRKNKKGNWYCLKCLYAAGRRAKARDIEANRTYHRRYKKHRRGDHSECLPEKCPDAPAPPLGQ